MLSGWGQALPQLHPRRPVVTVVTVLGDNRVPEPLVEVEIAGQRDANSKDDVRAPAAERLLLRPVHERTTRAPSLHRRVDGDPPHLKVAARCDGPAEATDGGGVQLRDRTAARRQV